MGEARGIQAKMHGGAKSRQKKSQCKCEKDVHPRQQLVTNVTKGHFNSQVVLQDYNSQCRGAEPGHCISKSPGL